MLLCIAAFLFNRSANAAFENETYRVHSFNTTPKGVIDSTKNSFPVRVISMMSPLLMSSTGFILCEYNQFVWFACTSVRKTSIISPSIINRMIYPSPVCAIHGVNPHSNNLKPSCRASSIFIIVVLFLVIHMLTHPSHLFLPSLSSHPTP